MGRLQRYRGRSGQRSRPVDDAGIRRNQQHLGNVAGQSVAHLWSFQPDSNRDSYTQRNRHTHSDDCSDADCDCDRDADSNSDCDADTNAYYGADSHTDCDAEPNPSPADYHDVVTAKRKDGGALFGRGPGEWRRFALYFLGTQGRAPADPFARWHRLNLRDASAKWQVQFQGAGNGLDGCYHLEELPTQDFELSGTAKWGQTMRSRPPEGGRLSCFESTHEAQVTEDTSRQRGDASRSRSHDTAGTTRSHAATEHPDC